MWTRATLKSRGQTAFTANYWKSVLVALIIALVIGGSAGGVSGSTGGSSNTTNEQGGSYSYSEDMVPYEDGNGQLDNFDQKQALTIAGIVAGIGAVLGTVGIVVKLLVFNPLEVGCRRFFLVNSYSPAELSEMGYGFKNGYSKMIFGIFMRDLYLFLWSLLFIIPGWIKSYSYRMVPYILAENPDMGANEAITVSRRMMNGHKWDTFVLDLSFIGWYILSIFTLGLLSVFYVNPYKEATDAELYKVVKELYLAQNATASAPAYAAVTPGADTQEVAVAPEQGVDEAQ